MYDNDLQMADKHGTDVLAAWSVYLMTVAGLATCSLLELFS